MGAQNLLQGDSLDSFPSDLTTLQDSCQSITDEAGVARFLTCENLRLANYSHLLQDTEGGKGLPEWMEADRNLSDTQICLWHSFGVAHIPRVEDFPVMPVEVCGFSLKPCGFFDGNPAIDLPFDSDKASRCCSNGV